jgi:hypothetical protein
VRASTSQVVVPFARAGGVKATGPNRFRRTGAEIDTTPAPSPFERDGGYKHR